MVQLSFPSLISSLAQFLKDVIYEHTWANKNMFKKMQRAGKVGTQGQENPGGSA